MVRILGLQEFLTRVVRDLGVKRISDSGCFRILGLKEILIQVVRVIMQ
jgi:hypothetical protein